MAYGLLQRLLYPLVLIGALAILWALLQVGARLPWAPYAAAAIVAPFVILGERVMPYRRHWWPDRQNLIADGLYMAVVQLMVPMGLAWLAVWSTQRAIGHSFLMLAIWPVS